jgi:hypothetical protein
MLYREYYFADVQGGVTEDDFVLQYTTFIAQNIDEIDFYWDGTELTVTVTASVEGIAGKQEETRTYITKPRPDTF